MNKIVLQNVKYLPRELSSGILYVSNQYAVAGHLCACGCGNKVITPLGPTEWKLSEYGGVPTVYPSIGNWQLPCRSHYFITSGQIQWAPQWSDAQIAAGRQAEQEKRQAYYASLDHQRGFWFNLRSWLSRLIER